MQEGAYVANIIREECTSGQAPQRRAFRYKDKGSMATIGRGKAVVSFGRFSFGGFLAWATWGAVHLATMADLQSKISVLGAWIASYVFGSRRSRLITGDPQLKMKQLRGDIQLRKDQEAGDTE
jgi:NADH dehydrogenase